jgi:glycosyltransferase involved in cell wall biosynthesis
VPFVRGGAELMADDLVAALRARGHEADLVTVPFKWYPGTRVLDQAFLWRLVDLTESDGVPIDRVIATKFPAYCVRHPNKVAWVLHQFRQAYDYDRTELGQFDESPSDRATRRAAEPTEADALEEARPVLAAPANVDARLRRFNGIESTVLPHPPQSLPYREAEPEGFVLSVNRLDRAKRIDLLIEAAKREPSLRVVITGEGPDRDRLERLAAGLNGQVRFVGRAGDDELVDLYARSLAVYYAPADEDFGMVPYEAFLSGKPVVTARDAGGPLEVVHDRETGLVVEPEPEAVARACAYLAAHADEARAWGHAGRALAERVTWDACVDALLR